MRMQKKFLFLYESFLEDGLTVFWKKPSAKCGVYLLIFLVLFSLIGPFFSPMSYSDTCLAMKNEPPFSSYFFGSDELGRSIFVRVCFGMKISLLIGVSAAVIDLCLGVLVGGLSVLFNAKIREILVNFVNIINALPNLLIVILLTVIMKGGIFTLILAMGITGWINMARISRSEFLHIRGQNYVLAAQSLGASKSHLFFRHYLPNAMGPIITTMTLTIPQSIFLEAYLSFLGLGVRPPIASLGTMICSGISAFEFYPWRLVVPSIFISLVIFSFYLIGDGLHYAFNPKREGYGL